jgi:hypothetical protein
MKTAGSHQTIFSARGPGHQVQGIDWESRANQESICNDAWSYLRQTCIELRVA